MALTLSVHEGQGTINPRATVGGHGPLHLDQEQHNQHNNFRKTHFFDIFPFPLLPEDSAMCEHWQPRLRLQA